MNAFTPAPSELFFSRHDTRDPRLGELAGKTAGSGVTILGYPDEEGVSLNGGRAGAKEGPDAIRKWLYRLTPHPQLKLRPFSDAGNLHLGPALEKRHEISAEKVQGLLEKGERVLGLGGGNDYAFADGYGFLKACASSKEKPVIVNVDAHLDVRGTEKGLSSGTPFYRLLESGLEFDFIELGIQTISNSRAHWEYVQKHNGRIVTMDEILTSGVSLLETVSQRLSDLLLKRRPAYLAIDIDAFAYPFAAGSSAPWPLGILPHDFYPLLSLLLNRWDVRVMGIYEVAPSLESGHSAAKLAAQWAHLFLHEPG